MTLHAEAEAYLRRLRGAASRVDRRAAATDADPPLPAADGVEDRMLPARSGPRPVRLIRPAGTGGRALPVVLYFHGGGFMAGGLEECAREAHRLAAAGPALVVCATYRLAPAHPYPAAIDDGYDALVWTFENAARWQGDARRLAVAGRGAGGNLATAVAHLSAVSNGPPVRLVYLLCPWLDLTLSQPSVGAFAGGYGLDRGEIEACAEAYLGDSGDAGDPMISPALHDPPPNFPPTRILAAECDPLRDEARLFARRLARLGIRADLIEAPGMIHGFDALLHMLPAGAPYVAAAESALADL